MDIGYWIRNKIFWSICKYKGKPISKYLQEYNTYFGKEPDKVKKLQDERLKNLIRHASETTIFYKKYKNIDNLNDFPIINKEMLKANLNEFLSCMYNKDDMVITTTSGSTGAPFTYYLTKEKKYRQNAEVIFFNNWGRCDVGTKHGYVRVTKTKSKIKLLMQNEILMDPTSITDEWLEKQRKKLLNKNIKSLIGYPSAISALAEYCIQKGNKPSEFGIEGIITSSETLYDSTRKLINDAFGCDVISRYSTEEFGVLAHECSRYNVHHINELSYIIEVLEINSDKPVKPGELGRVVVTDLYSYAMPLIRYDTGDLAILGEGCNCGLETRTLERIEGRQIETIYDINKKRVSPFAINGAMRDLKNVYQYQFIQNDINNNTIKLKVQEDFNEEQMLIKRFKAILGETTAINVEYVDEIPKLKSGKRPYIISNYKKI